MFNTDPAPTGPGRALARHGAVELIPAGGPSKVTAHLATLLLEAADSGYVVLVHPRADIAHP